VIRVLKKWAKANESPASSLTLCEVWESGDASGECEANFSRLIELLKKEFTDRTIRLIPDDLKDMTVIGLVVEINSIPAVEAFASALRSAALTQPEEVGTTSPAKPRKSARSRKKARKGAKKNS
jgi:hypothetical protein